MTPYILLLLFPTITIALSEKDRRREHNNNECSADEPWPNVRNTLGSRIMSDFLPNGRVGMSDTNLRQCRGVSKYLVTWSGFNGWQNSNIGLISLLKILSAHNLISTFLFIYDELNLILSF